MRQGSMLTGIDETRLTRFAIEVRTYQDSPKIAPEALRDVLSIHTSKSLENAAGEWSIGLKDTSRARDWWNRIAPMDVVKIHLRRGAGSVAGDGALVFRGLVDSDAEAGSVQPAHTELALHGRCMGKLLLNTQYYTDPRGQYAAQKVIAFSAPENNFIPNHTPEDAIREVLDTYFFKFVNTPTHYGKLLTYRPRPVDLGLVSVQVPSEAPISVWSLCEMAAIKPFAELFVTERGVLVYRRKPWLWDWGNPDLDNPRVAEISEADLLTWNVAATDAELINFVQVVPTLTLFGDTYDTLAAGRYPRIDTDATALGSILRYGLKMAMIEVPLGAPNIKGGDQAPTSILATMELMARTYHAWYRRPFTMATVTVKGGYFEVGKKLTFRHRDTRDMAAPLLEGEWYVTQVEQEFVFGQHWHSTLTLVESRDRPHRPVGQLLAGGAVASA